MKNGKILCLSIIIIATLFISEIQAGIINEAETSVHGLTFSHPAYITVTNPVSDTSREMKKDVIHLRSDNTFNAMFYIFKNSSEGEKSANNLMSFLSGVNSFNTTSKSIFYTILGSRRKGTAFTPKASLPSAGLSSELFLFKEFGNFFIIYLVYAHPQDDAVRDAILSSMKYKSGNGQ